MKQPGMSSIDVTASSYLNAFSITITESKKYLIRWSKINVHNNINKIITLHESRLRLRKI